MAVKTYKKSSPTKLSEHFNSYEFRCGLGRGCSCQDTLIDDQLYVWLENIRAHFGGRKITITSAYRCQAYNKSIGSTSGSYHTRGQAVDFVVQGIPPRQVAAYAESIGILGIGLYETAADGHFVHIDSRTRKAFWYGQAQAYRSTFGGVGGVTVNPGTPTTGGESGSGLKRGCNGATVKQLQEKLIKLGYDCGPRGADGDFGAKTEEAVRKFQKESGLSVDGVAGPLTMAALQKKMTGDFSAGDKITVTASLLNVRNGAGISYAAIGTTKNGSKYTLSEVKDGWGKLKERSGWVSLEYCKKIDKEDSPNG